MKKFLSKDRPNRLEWVWWNSYGMIIFDEDLYTLSGNKIETRGTKMYLP